MVGSVGDETMSMKKERILSGVMTLLILTKLLDGPSYGYLLERHLAMKLGRPIPPGTVYVILASLKRKRLVSVKDKTVHRGKGVTNYEITNQGREFLLRHKEPMRTLKRVTDELIRSIEGIEEK